MVSLMTNKKRIRVKEVMKSNYGTISRNATIAEALKEMKRLQTTVLVVDKRDENDEYGLLLVSDIARKVLAKDRASSRVNTYESHDQTCGLCRSRYGHPLLFAPHGHIQPDARAGCEG